MTIAMQRRAPAVDFVPAELHGELIVAVTCCYAIAALARRSSGSVDWIAEHRSPH
jgi:hypothetical protein